MRIWRVEHKETEAGPYCFANDINLIMLFGNGVHNDKNHPGTIPDFNRYCKKDEVHGFPSKKALRNWFSIEELKELFKYGYKIRTFNVPENNVTLGASGKQVLFEKPKLYE